MVKKNCQPQVPLKTQKGNTFPIKSSIPPGYYTSKAGKPGIFKTATGSVSWKYSTLDTASIRKAEGIAIAGVEIVGHLELKHGSQLMLKSSFQLNTRSVKENFPIL